MHLYDMRHLTDTNGTLALTPCFATVGGLLAVNTVRLGQNWEEVAVFREASYGTRGSYCLRVFDALFQVAGK